MTFSLLWSVYADARVFANLFDDATRTMLERMLVAAEGRDITQNISQRTNNALQIHIHLSLVYQVMQIKPQAR